ncbi:MAG: ATP-binding protein, partial [Veillonella sp.]|nr:ATP-binding protein [Veillonella sp.]
DTRQFKRIIDNIVSNALKYKVADQGHLAISLRNDKEWVQVVMADDGPGVDSSDLPKLFDTFYRTDKARTNTENGSGLGLAIVKQLVEGMHGNITASQTNGGGLTITINLPLQD